MKRWNGRRWVMYLLTATNCRIQRRVSIFTWSLSLHHVQWRDWVHPTTCNKKQFLYFSSLFPNYHTCSNFAPSLSLPFFIPTVCQGKDRKECVGLWRDQGATRLVSQPWQIFVPSEATLLECPELSIIAGSDIVAPFQLLRWGEGDLRNRVSRPICSLAFSARR